jgi:hypothetical protein
MTDATLHVRTSQAGSPAASADRGRTGRRPGAAPILLALVLVLAGSRTAVGLSIVPDPLGLSGAATGSLDLLAVVTGVPAGGTVQFGSVSGSDTTLVFGLSISSHEAGGDPFYALVSSGTIVGAGVIAGADLAVAPDLSIFDPPLSEAAVVGDPAGDFDVGVVPGQVYDPFFVSFSSLSPGDTLSVLPCTAFPFASCVAELELGEASVVPGPPTSALLLLGAAFALGRGRRLAASPTRCALRTRHQRVRPIPRRGDPDRRGRRPGWSGPLSRADR